MKVSEPRPKISEPDRQTPVTEPLMLTTLELVDRSIQIEWATTLKSKPNATQNEALGLLIAEWAATFGPWSCIRILRVTFHALLHPVWRSRAIRTRNRTESGYLRHPK